MTAVSDAMAGSSPRWTPSASSFIPVRTAVSDASSGRGAEETPFRHDRDRHLAGGGRHDRDVERVLVPVVAQAPVAHADDLAEILLDVVGVDHQRLAAGRAAAIGPARTGSPESAEHAGHCLAPGESSRDVLISPLLSAGGVSRSPGH